MLMAIPGPPVMDASTADEVRNLSGVGALPEDMEVVFEATEGTADSTPEKAGPQLNRQAGLRIGSVRLRVQGKP